MYKSNFNKLGVLFSPFVSILLRLIRVNIMIKIKTTGKIKIFNKSPLENLFFKNNEKTEKNTIIIKKDMIKINGLANLTR